MLKETSKTALSCGLARPWTQCEWAISPGYSPVVLSFQRFSLARADTVTVYDGSRKGDIIATFTGTLPARLPPARMVATCSRSKSAAVCTI